MGNNKYLLDTNIFIWAMGREADDFRLNLFNFSKILKIAFLSVFSFC
ncbi:MAG: hypothetical protein UV09_C0002G0010 [Candidatus Gottesmanbacteria bacterium GW2011_GWA2_42_18]|uniref:PIN domain-containing protein n=1 Tax=Candidatus Gottesmanbacteria bacterium GW2011_GWA2_42_18 TaxID=1618442 RepID=A0A0G0ZGI4_9BACT|nr:MAG: hypothetical protein UV09_C0002G0010 [Candidatus Gottesmanbacteria bacterium GW2011_GWA2_42_18]